VRHLGACEHVQARRNVGPAPDQCLVQRDAKGELIAACVDVSCGVLLGRHVRRRSDHGALDGQRRFAVDPVRVGGHAARSVRPGRARARQPEVGDPWTTVRAEQDVARLEIAMNDPGRMGGHEPATGCDQPVDNLRRIASSVAHPLPERRPLHELHRDEAAPIAAHDVVDRHDIGMTEPRQRPRLPFDPSAVLCTAAVQHLDGNLSLQPRVERAIDPTHPALTHELQQRVASNEPHEFKIGPKRPSAASLSTRSRTNGPCRLHIASRRVHP